MPLVVVEGKLRSFALAEGVALNASRILLAVSGGVDSMVMLEIFLKLQKRIGYDLGLAHLNHGMRTDSLLDHDLCRQSAEQAGIPYFYKELSPGQIKGSIENWARHERYAFLKTVAHENGFDWIMTAHHQDDQVETVYMRQKSGAHWTSLIGIRESIGKLRRPMLQLTKNKIENFAIANGVIWREDSTNTDIRFQRNRVRHHDLPQALAKDAGLYQKLLKVSREATNRLDEISKKLELLKPVLLKFVNLETVEIVFDKSNFQKLQSDEKKILIQSLTSKINNDDYITATADHWESFWQYISVSDTGTVFDLTGTLSCLIDRNSIILYNQKKFADTQRKRITFTGISWFDGTFKVSQAQGAIPSNDKNRLLISKVRLNNGLFVRQWEKGDRIFSYSLKKSVKISDLYINHKLSRLEKLKHPVVVNFEDEIIWLPGITHSLSAHNGLNMNGEMLKIKWLKKEKN